MRVVLDTNVLVSGLLSAQGSPGRIVDAVMAGRIVPVMSMATLAELEDVLHRPRLQIYFRRADVTPFQFLTTLHALADFVSPKASKQTIRDAKDRPFIELCATRPKPEFIVTGDRDFEQARYHGVKVIGAAEFAKLLAADA